MGNVLERVFKTRSWKEKEYEWKSRVIRVDDPSLEELLAHFNWDPQGRLPNFTRLREDEMEGFLVQLDTVEKEQLRTFLVKLLYADKFTYFGQGLLQLAEHVINIVRTLSKVDGDVRCTLLDVLWNSSTGCEENPVAALCQVEMLHQILLARGNRENMLFVGRQVMYMEEIEKAARDLYEHEDEDYTSALLGLLILLTAELNLPFNITEFENPCENTALRAPLVSERCRGFTEEQFHTWLGTWSEWQREERILVLSEIEWSDLKVYEDHGRSLDPVYNVLGEVCEDPVLVGSTWWSWRDFTQHWQETGRDIFNVPVDKDQIRFFQRRDSKSNESSS